MEGLAIGRDVIYVRGMDVSGNPIERAAKVVKVWNKSSGGVNLCVFRDGSDDSMMPGPFQQADIVTSCLYSEEPKSYTWHWPVRV